MASIQPIPTATLVPPAKPQTQVHVQPSQPQRSEEAHEATREMRREARTRTEEPSPASSGGGGTIDLTA